MDNNTFKKKFNELGSDVKRLIDKMFGRVDSAQEFKTKFESIGEKGRQKLIRAGATVLSLAILCGFAGCNDGVQNQPDTTQVTLVSDNEITTVNPNYTTRKPEVEVTPGVSETTKTPSVDVTPSDTTTIVPNDTTKTPSTGTSTPSEGTTQTPSTDTTTIGSGEGTTTPSTPEDLPADADGYAYPEFFKNKLREWVVVDRVLDGYSYDALMQATDPEIIYVDRETHTSDEPNPIVIYAKYTLNEAGTNVQYVRFVASTLFGDYRLLGFPSEYTSYGEYIGAIQKALEKKCEFVSAEVSEINSKNLIDLNNQIGEGFAKFLGEEYVDAEINFVRANSGDFFAGIMSYNEYWGFAYDKDGKSYSFYVQVDGPDNYYEHIDQMVKDIENGKIKKEECVRVDVTVKRIDSVFTKSNENDKT